MYPAIVTVFAILSISAFVILFIRCGFLQKLLVKLGIKKKRVTMNWTAFSWESCLKKMHCEADVVFFGDSIIRGGDFHEQFPEYAIVNLGASGDTLAGMIGRVSTIQALSPKKIFLMGGINGLTNRNIACSASQYEDLIKEIENKIPDAELYILSTLPVTAEKARRLCTNATIKRFNKEIEEIADRHGHTYIDLYSLYLCDGQLDPELSVDGLHLKPEGYEKWYQTIAPCVLH